MAREKMPEFKRKGNWKNAPGSQATTKKTPVGMGAKPKPKPAKPKIGAGAKPKAKPGMPKTTSSSDKAKVKDYKRTGKVAPEPSEGYKRLLRNELKGSERAKKAFKTGSILSGTPSNKEERTAFARSGTSYKAGFASRRRKAEKNQEAIKKREAKKPQSRSGSMVLGQGRNSAAAKKLKRTVGYGR